jgi:hypothetical protein
MADLKRTFDGIPGQDSRVAARNKAIDELRCRFRSTRCWLTAAVAPNSNIISISSLIFRFQYILVLSLYQTS